VGQSKNQAHTPKKISLKITVRAYNNFANAVLHIDNTVEPEVIYIMWQNISDKDREYFATLNTFIIPPQSPVIPISHTHTPIHWD
jgi:hypothetical protein